MSKFTIDKIKLQELFSQENITSGKSEEKIKSLGGINKIINLLHTNKRTGLRTSDTDDL